jgi:hypothetical protein
MTRLRILVTGSLAAVVLTVAGGLAFSSTISADPGAGDSCVGEQISDAAHITHEELDVPFGQFAHDQEPFANPGALIQAIGQCR